MNLLISVKGSLCALSLYLGQLSEVVERSQGVELLQRQHQSLVRRWVHEVKVNEVIDACKQKGIPYCTSTKSVYWSLCPTREWIPHTPRLFSSRTTFPKLVL